jgi:integrase
MAYNHGFTSTGINLKTKKKPIAEPISQETIFSLGQTIDNLQDRALFYFLYLTGCRITEALQVMCSEVRSASRRLKSGRKVRAIAVDLITLKRRSGIPRRTVYINPMGIDREMLAIIEKLMLSRQNLNDMLFNYGDVRSQRARKKAYWHIKQVTYSIRGIAPPDGRMVLMPDFGLNLHYLRHCRATHLSETYGYSDRELMLYFGWSSTNPANTYANRNPVELLGRIVDVDGGIDAKT